MLTHSKNQKDAANVSLPIPDATVNERQRYSRQMKYKTETTTGQDREAGF